MIQNTYVEGLEITSGPADVIASGTIISFEGNPVKIKFGPADGRLTIIFSFENKKDQNGESNPYMNVKSLDSKTAEFKLFNFNNSLGNGTINPLPIGTLWDKKLYLHFYVYAQGGARDKIIHYTLFQSGTVYNQPMESKGD
jgi:hypothetical protein